MIKLVIFDIGKVIIDFDHHLTTKRLTGFCPYPEPEIYTMIFKDPLFYEYEKGNISSANYFHQVRQKLSLRLDYYQFFQIWGDIFSLIPGMEDIISKLKKRVKLFALSNIDHMHFEYLNQKFSVSESFDKMILSYEAHSRKPEYAIYQEAIKQAGIPASSSLFIDDIAQNVDAFIQMGGYGRVFPGAKDLKTYLVGLGLMNENE